MKFGTGILPALVLAGGLAGGACAQDSSQPATGAPAEQPAPSAEPAAPATQSNGAPAQVSTLAADTIAPPPPGKGQVIFYRRGGMSAPRYRARSMRTGRN